MNPDSYIIMTPIMLYTVISKLNTPNLHPGPSALTDLYISISSIHFAVSTWAYNAADNQVLLGLLLQNSNQQPICLFINPHPCC